MPVEDFIIYVYCCVADIYPELLRILTIMNTHSYHREHLLYSRIGLGVFLP